MYIEEMFKETCCKQCRHVKFKGTMIKMARTKTITYNDKTSVSTFSMHTIIFFKKHTTSKYSSCAE